MLILTQAYQKTATATMPRDGTVTKRFGVIKAIDRAHREIEFVASRQEIDRDGDVIITRGIDTANFRRNPVLLLDHDRGQRLGRVDSLTVERDAFGVDQLVGRASILPAGVSPAADQAYAELLHAALGGVSIGFLPTESDYTSVLRGQTGKTHRRTQLLEISIVPIPACASCTVTAKSWRGSEPVLEINDAEMVSFRDSDFADACGAVFADALSELVAEEIGTALWRQRGRID
ncbi:MAG: hypothetical protein E8D45_07860 [Nitrospira sp.]|nr:MAG: hypothetical protein E8D45_07860 [Nitrospira sp.]